MASAKPTFGSDQLLDASSAVFLAAKLSRHGEPWVKHALVRILMLGVLDNGLKQQRVDSFVREILVGLIVIGAAALAAFSRRNRKH